MKMMKRCLALIVLLSVLSNISGIAFAHGSDETEYYHTSLSFFDGEGKKNTIVLSYNDTNTTFVEHFVDDELINKTTIVLVSEYDGEDALLSINVEDIKNNVSIEYTDYISTYVSDMGLDETTLLGDRSYVYSGQINYNTYYDEFGVSHSDKLSIYQNIVSSVEHNKLISAVNGDYVSTLIGVISNVLLYYYNPLAALANTLFYAAAEPVISYIWDGIIHCALSKEYKVCETSINVKAKDMSSGRETVYPSSRYSVKLSDNTYSSSYYYDGYLPWNSNNIAYWMFCDFWNYSYPGVASYS